MANLVKVTGTVTFEGSPLPEGTVSFAPSDPGGQPAIGKIKDGKFSMATPPSSVGVVAGKYQVMIQSTTAVDDAAPPLKAGDAPVEAPKSLIPEKYADFKTSGIEVDVEPGMAPFEWELEP